MPANTAPIFPLTPKNVWPATALTAANTSRTGLGTLATDIMEVFVAGANGARVDYIKVRSLGTCIATVMRVFLNNGSINTTIANNALFMERTIAATTAATASELADTVIPMNISLLAGHRVLVTIGTAVADGLMPVGVGGDY